MNLIQQLEQEEIARLNKEIPEFAPGDTVVVSVRVVEGSRSRLQAYEGVVIARRNRGLNSNFIVRKISSGEGVERTFQLYSPTVEKIEVKRRGDVRRAKLYYLRGLTGKAARIKEKLPARKGSAKELQSKIPTFQWGFLFCNSYNGSSQKFDLKNIGLNLNQSKAMRLPTAKCIKLFHLLP